jgi:hypothetical protein
MCCTHRALQCGWMDAMGPFRGGRKVMLSGSDYSETKFGPFRESGYSTLRAASVRTPQLLRPDRSFTFFA